MPDLYSGQYATNDGRGQPALSIDIRYVPPDPAAIKLTGKHLDGVPEGMHTGGPYRWQDEVWKPLDARPYPNCDWHYPTDEMQALTELADIAFIPKVWRYEYRAGRHWIVRPYAMLYGQELNFMNLRSEVLLELEQAIIEIGRRGWELNEEPTLGYCRSSKQLHLIDFSAAQHNPPPLRFNDDHDRFLSWLKKIDHPQLANLRHNGRQALHDYMLAMLEDPNHYTHAYASFHRPLGSWARIEQPHVITHTDHPNWQNMTPHSWVLTTEPLPDAKIKSIELQLAWFPRS